MISANNEGILYRKISLADIWDFLNTEIRIPRTTPKREKNADNKETDAVLPQKTFLEKAKDQISEISHDARKACIDMDSYQNGVFALERIIKRQKQDVNLMLSDPDTYIANSNKDSLSLEMPFIRGYSRKRFIEKGIEKRLRSIGGLAYNLEGFIGEREKRIDDVLARTDSINRKLTMYSAYHERTARGKNAEKHYAKVSEAFRQRLALYKLAVDLENSKELLHSKSDDIGCLVTRHRSDLERLVRTASIDYDIEVRKGDYKVKRYGRSKRLVPALLATAFITGCVLYSQGSIMDYLKQAPLTEQALLTGGYGRVTAAENPSAGAISKHAEPESDSYAIQSETAESLYTFLIRPQFTPDLRMIDNHYFDVPEEIRELDLSEGEYAVYINKEMQTLELFRRTEWVRAAEYIISTGRNAGDKKRSGDNKTPETPLSIGKTYKPFFRIVSMQNSSSWNYGSVRRAYGPWFMRLDCGRFSGYSYNPDGRCPIGIHGTPSEWEQDLGQPASHGCIRMYNDDLEELHNAAGVGTPVLIRGTNPDIKRGDEQQKQQTAENQYISAENAIPMSDADPSR